jgi:hypothetical protein
MVELNAVGSQGSYSNLMELFNMTTPSDNKRFLAFPCQHYCHLPFHPCREPRSEAQAHCCNISLRV